MKNVKTTIAKLFAFATNTEISRIIETEKYTLIEGSKGQTIRVADNFGNLLICNNYTDTLNYIALMSEEDAFNHVKSLIKSRLKNRKTSLAFSRKSKGKNGEPIGSTRLMVASLLKSSIEKMKFSGVKPIESPYLIRVIDETINQFRSFDLRTVIGFSLG